MKSHLLRKRLLPILSMLALGWACQLQAQDWTRFRGPNGTGYVKDGSIPSTWTAQDISWTTTLPGGGISSPVAWGDKIFLLAADKTSAQRLVVCIDLKSGKLLWRVPFDSVPHHLHQRNRFASSTPCCNATHVYVAWSEPQHTTVTCLSHDGNVIWQKDLGTWQSQHGFATSPMLYDDMVVVFDSQQADQLKPGEEPGESMMVAMNQKTGDIVWQTPMATTRVCYGTPCVYQPPERSLNWLTPTRGTDCLAWTHRRVRCCGA
ncbi:MAG: PQQ-binding-like beta-propeller repeat protein [Pirellulaceae bacterium]